jgi:hypothetical protein
MPPASRQAFELHATSLDDALVHPTARGRKRKADDQFDNPTKPKARGKVIAPRLHQPRYGGSVKSNPQSKPVAIETVYRATSNAKPIDFVDLTIDEPSTTSKRAIIDLTIDKSSKTSKRTTGEEKRLKR